MIFTILSFIFSLVPLQTAGAPNLILYNGKVITLNARNELAEAVAVRDGKFVAIGKTADDYPDLTWTNAVIANLVPVTLGNIIGGVLLVGGVYWFVFLRKKPPAP